MFPTDTAAYKKAPVGAKSSQGTEQPIRGTNSKTRPHIARPYIIRYKKQEIGQCSISCFFADIIVIFAVKESKIRTIHRKMKSSDLVDPARPGRACAFGAKLRGRALRACPHRRTYSSRPPRQYKKRTQPMLCSLFGKHIQNRYYCSFLVQTRTILFLNDISRMFFHIKLCPISPTQRFCPFICCRQKRLYISFHGREWLIITNDRLRFDHL